MNEVGWRERLRVQECQMDVVYAHVLPESCTYMQGMDRTRPWKENDQDGTNSDV